MVELLGLAALGFAVGAYGTIIGAGGGFILVPVLIFLYPDYDPEHVTAISLAVVTANATSGSVAYARQKRIDYVTGLLFAAASVPGVIAGALVVHLVPERLFTGLFGGMLVGLAAFSIRGTSGGAIRPPQRGPGVLLREVRDPEGRVYRYGYKVWQGVALSVVIGFVSSLFGIGGGVIQVPAMIVLLHMPIHFAVATSQFVLAFMTGGASAVHLLTGSLSGDELVKVLALAAGAVPGAQAGALIAPRIKGRVVLLLLASAILVLGARLLLRAITGV